MRMPPLAVMFLASATIANAATDDCQGVIQLSKVAVVETSDTDTVEQHAANFCDEYSKYGSNSKSASFAASYKFLSTSYGGSSASVDSVASKCCSASNISKASKDAYRRYIEVISPGAYPAYKECLRTKNEDLRYDVDAETILPTQFSLTAAFVSSEGKKEATVTFTTSSGVSCHWDETSEKKRNIPNGKTAILECNRTDATKPAYVTVVRSDATPKPLTLPWKAYDKDGNPVDSLARLQENVASLQTQIGGVTRDLKRVLFETSTFDIVAEGTPSLVDDTHCSDKEGMVARGQLKGRVNFKSSFATIPIVTAAIQSIQLQGNTHRLKLNVKDVDSAGFNYEFYTWCDTRVHEATATYAAMAK